MNLNASSLMKCLTTLPVPVFAMKTMDSMARIVRWTLQTAVAHFAGMEAPVIILLLVLKNAYVLQIGRERIVPNQ